MTSHNGRNPAGGPGSVGAYDDGMHVQNASAEPLLQRLEHVRKSGNGWRAKCPSCGGRSDRDKLVITESDGRVLVYCHGGCRGDAVLAAAGMTWADLHPPRHWPQSPEERERARRAMRDAGIASVREVLALEGAVIEAAGRELQEWGFFLSEEDGARLTQAVERVFSARTMLSKPQQWRPNARTPSCLWRNAALN